jgi:hypothetical protein
MVLMVLSVSCETEKIIFKGPYHVRFTESTLAEKESFSKPIKIELHVAGPPPESDVTVSYAIGGSAREGIDYTIGGTRGSVVIPKGQYFGYIEIQLVNNSNNILRSQDILLTLQGVEGGAFQIGQGSAGIGKTFTFTIFDDCILGGTYQGTRGAFSLPVRNIQITSQDCENYRLSNWNINIFSFDDPLDLFFVDNFDNTLTIPEQEEEDFPEEFATIRGTGVVNPQTREIIMTITLVDFDDEPQITFTLTPD